MGSRFCLTCVCALALLPFSTTSSPLLAQTLHLKQLSSESARVEAAVGDTVSIQIRANLGSLSATGFTLFVRFSSTASAPIDADGNAANGLQPFVQGSLFQGAVEFDNATISNGLVASDEQVIGYSAGLGGGDRQASSGSGDVATFRLRCLEATESDVSIYRSPIHETRLVLSDGRSERDFRQSAPLTVGVTRGVSASPWSAIKAGPR